MKISNMFPVILLSAISILVSAQCPPAVTFTDPGIFHIPTVATPVKRITHQPPAGTYYKIHVTLDVKISQWDATNPQNLHEIFWLVRDAKNLDMMGYVAVKGPGGDELMLRDGVGVDHGHKSKITEKTKLFAYTFVPGNTYTFDYTYDAGNRFIQLLVIDKANGQQRMRLTSATNVDNISFSATQDVTMDFAYDPAMNPNEVATYGWEYSNLKIEMFDDKAPVIASSSVVKATCASCPDGQAQVDVTGGAAPYTYSWGTPGNTAAVAAGLLPGGYTFTATDSKGCVARKKVAVGLLPVPGVIEPVKISSDPHWVEYKGQQTYLAGFTHGLGSLAQQNNYHKTYIDWLAANKINCFRNTPFMGQEYQDVQGGGMKSPFKRTGPGLANDGKPKYDLTQYDAAFFTYWKNVLTYAQSKDLIVFVTLLDGWHLRQWDKNQCNGNSTGSSGEWCHTYDVYYGANNINGVNAANITQYHDNTHAVNTWQKKFLEKMVDELGSFPNVIWEVANENFQNRDWEAKLGEYVTNYELSKGMTPHLVLGRDIPNHEQTPGGRQTWAVEDLHSGLAAMHGNPMPHLFHNDGPNQGSATLMRQLTWQALTAGANANIFSVTNWNVKDSIEMSSADYQDRLRYVGYSKKFLNDFNVDLRGMKPDTNLASNNYLDRWVLGRSGSEYIVYFKTGGSSTLSGMPANYNAFWFNPRNGTSQAATPASGSTFTAPDNNDWVLYVRKPKQTDVQISETSSPLPSNCRDTMDVSVLIKNNGTLDLFSAKISYKLDNGAAVTKTQTFSPWVKTGEKRWIFLTNELKGIAQGSHTLKIWTSNPNDANDPNNANDTLILAFNVTNAGKSLMFSEDFENGLPADWSTFNPDGKENWFVFGGAGYNSAKSVVVNNHAYTGAYFESDYLAMPEVNLSTSQSPQLSFWYAHASKPVAYRYDSLSISISTDCAKTFQSIWSAGGNALNTAAANANLFIPASSAEWMNATVDLSPYKNATDAIIVLHNWSNNNNSLLIDKINITDVTAVQEVNSERTISVFPSPATDHITVSYALDRAAEVNIRLINSIGQVVYSQYSSQQAGTNTYRLEVSSLPSGVYQVAVTGNEVSFNRKFVVTK